MKKGKTRLEFFERGFAQWGLEIGAVSTSVFMRYIHYKDYKMLRDSGYNKKEAILITAERTKCSESTVWRSVQYFS